MLIARKKFPPIICMDEFYTSKFTAQIRLRDCRLLSKELVDVYYSRKCIICQINYLRFRIRKKNVKVVIIDMGRHIGKSSIGISGTRLLRLILFM